MHRFRVVFPDRFSGLLKAHFRDTEHIAHFFGVKERTARDWVNGVSNPNGPSAIIACARIPGALAHLIGVAA